MSAKRVDQILSIIDLALDGPDMATLDGRYCWYCQQSEHNEGPSGLCHACLATLRDPALSISPPPTGRTDAENPAILEGAYQHRPRMNVPAPWSRCWWGPR